MKDEQDNHGMNPLPSGSLLFHERYRVLRVLGQGGFGITYEAEQTTLGRRVAIKECFLKVHCERSQDSAHVTSFVSSCPDFERYRSTFLKEARIMAGMEHPHIVRIIDLFEENGTAYYVMDYLPGGSLSDMVKRSGPLPPDTAVRYVREVGSALTYLHGHRINHLDIKPGNILLDGDGHAVLIDFGLSKHYDCDGEETGSPPVGISDGYAPIEHYGEDGFRGFSPESDIYALGATLYYLLSGERPPAAYNVLNRGLPRPGVRIPDALWSSISKAMSPRRSSRPSSVDEFLSLLGIARSVVSREDVLEEETRLIRSSDRLYDLDNRVGKAVESRKADVSTNQDFSEYVSGVSFDMVYVSGGTFNEETPSGVHRGTLDGYWIGRHEVTQKLWAAVMSSNPSRFRSLSQKLVQLQCDIHGLEPSWFRGDDLPVVCVSWEVVQEFITRLNSLTGKKYRLPTGAEWEYAARGGSKSRGYKYSGSDHLDKVGWYEGNSGRRAHPVGAKLPNELGIYDMSGNVWEWCSDITDECERVYRGGSFYSDALSCRSDSFGSDPEFFSHIVIGFRLALSL